MAIKVGDALVALGLDKSKLDSGLKESEANVKTSMQKIQDVMKVAGAAFTAVGAAALKLSSDSRKMNADLSQAGLTIGVSTDEMRELALATTNVTFPLESVTNTFNLLARAGITSTEEMMAAATAFDTLADATGSSAEAVADMLIPAFKAFGKDLPQSAEELDRFAWLTKNTTVDLTDFSGMMTYLAKDMDTLDVSMDGAIAMLAALEAKGISGAAATRAFRTAVTQATNEGLDLGEALGLTASETGKYYKEIKAATGLTNQYAEAANSQYGILDKVKQKWSEITFALGSYLEPFEGVFAGLTAIGPVMMFFGTSVGTATVRMVAHTAAVVAHTIALGATKAALAVATAAQWLWNAAMSANPIGIVVIAIAALIAAIVLLVKNWDWVKEKTLAIWGAIEKFFTSVWDDITGVFSRAGLFIKDMWEGMLEWFKGIPAKIGGIFSTVTDWILAPFRAAFNGIEAGINWIIRQLNKISFTLPSWIPGIGGKTFGVNIPEISLPKFANGGLIPEPTLLYGMRSMRPYAIAGERGPEVVSPMGQSQTANITVMLDGKTIARAIGQPLVNEIRVRTGVRI